MLKHLSKMVNCNKTIYFSSYQ